MHFMNGKWKPERRKWWAESVNTYNDVFERLVNDLIIVRQTVELLCFQVEKHVVTFLYTVSVCMWFETTPCCTHNTHVHRLQRLSCTLCACMDLKPCPAVRCTHKWCIAIKIEANVNGQFLWTWFISPIESADKITEPHHTVDLVEKCKWGHEKFYPVPRGC